MWRWSSHRLICGTWCYTLLEFDLQICKVQFLSYKFEFRLWISEHRTNLIGRLLGQESINPGSTGKNRPRRPRKHEFNEFFNELLSFTSYFDIFNRRWTCWPERIKVSIRSNRPGFWFSVFSAWIFSVVPTTWPSWLLRIWITAIFQMSVRRWHWQTFGWFAICKDSATKSAPRTAPQCYLG